jgi:hypothetical protein
MVVAVLEAGRLLSRKVVPTVVSTAPAQQTPTDQPDNWCSMVLVALVEGDA